jgi:hypothetical protein
MAKKSINNSIEAEKSTAKIGSRKVGKVLPVKKVIIISDLLAHRIKFLT